MIKHYVTGLMLFVLIFSGNCHSSISPTVDNKQLKVGITSSLNKVFQKEPYNFRGELSNHTIVELALNEFEAIQIVLFPEADISGIQINASSLTHENNVDIIDSKFIQINPIGYVNLKVNEDDNVRNRFHPDILLPNQTLELQANILQPVLLTVYAPPGSKPGRYISEVTIKNEEGLYVVLELAVLVHPVQVPKQKQFKSLSLTKSHNYSALWPERLGFEKLNRQQESDVFRKISDYGFRNHLPPTGFLVNGLISYNWKGTGETYVTYPTHDRKTEKFDAVIFDEHINYMVSKGANSFFIGITSDIYKYEDSSKEREATLLKYLDDIIPHLKKRGLLEQSYLYNIDEPWGEAVVHAKKIYRLVKQRYGYDIHVIQNTNQNNDRVLGVFKNHFQAVDINLGFYKVTELQRYRDDYPNIFDDVWWNLNYWPRTRPNLFLEYPLIDARIIGPLSFRFNIQGFEYWDLIYTGKIKNYRPVKSNDFQLDWVVNHHSLDGLLLYPNENYDFYNSMRFESFRDGMEDLELLYVLQKLDPNNDLLRVKIVNDIDDYSEDIERYENFRRQLFSEILRFQKTRLQ